MLNVILLLRQDSRCPGPDWIMVTGFMDSTDYFWAKAGENGNAYVVDCAKRMLSTCGWMTDLRKGD